ncbi:MAG: homoserine dehydrogenase [Cardiobacteriaceae bacterium]|nr:homoserine dehydrogenase [Cardiobacteriaceae bacterium]
MSKNHEIQKEIQIGIIGYGTVGSGVVEVLEKNNDEIARRTGYQVKIKTVARRNWTGFDCEKLNFHCTENPREIVDDPEIAVVLELIGGEEPARSLIIQAMKNSKHIITANKALIAECGEELFQVAKEQGVSLSYEAAVAGGIPVIKVLREAMSGNKIDRVAGIINGTCNFILSQMQEKKANFADVLHKAQELGYAEADPSFDIDGIDAAHKLTILASLAFGVPLQFQKVLVEGIRNISAEDIENAAELGFVIRHLGIARRRENGIELRTHPTLINEDAMLARVSGVMNAVQIEGNAVGKTLYYGSGAGKLPTASAVVADLIDTIRDLDDDRASRIAPLGYSEIAYDTLSKHNELSPLSPDEFKSAFYLRLGVKDEVGTLAQITKILADNGISIASILQKTELDTDGIVPLIILTDPVIEKNMNLAVSAIENLPQTVGKLQKIRVGKF